MGLAALLCGCHPSEHDAHKAPLELSVTTPLRKDMVLVKDYVSQIRAIQHIEVRALERGYLQSTLVDEGQTVTEGQVMFQIMPTIYKAELNKALAELSAATLEYQNTRALLQQKIVSENELSLANASLQKAQAEVELAQAHLDFATIRAPFTGKMDELEVRTGSLLDEGELLTTLSDLSQMWVYFNVPEAEYLDYASQASTRDTTNLSLQLANGKLYAHKGKVDTIEADFDNTTGTIEFRASFPNPDGLLRHGQTGKILMEIPFDNALVIPQKATFEILDQLFVYVLTDENQVQQRHIKIAAELPHVFIVESGLTEDDQILLEGLRKVRDGQHIAPRKIAAQQALENLTLHAE